MWRSKTTEPETHVVFLRSTFSDAGSTPAASTTDFMETRYAVSLKKTDEGYSVWVPGLPGCASQGETEQEALDNIRDAIREYLDAVDDFTPEADRREVTVSALALMGIAGIPHLRAVRALERAVFHAD